ncbi:hypothetical protein E1B28_002839 [Marasmius oreades]|uniref:Uncharacterized protein n=1 Tax=Marasmius oreades TaxID=181124 RepID=A0A9P7RPY5_9AGAR|nr:uncharacterized protein E1B28_002839 [Marasmius oreades]KAG7086923.1 hypothetical protein E1B28_002839 [Marasmius oreades]
MPSSVRSSQTAQSRRRPPSPVSMYGSGSGFCVGPPNRPPRPLVLEKKPKAEAKTHTRLNSASTSTSAALSESSSSTTPSNASLKSASTKSFGFPTSWKKRGKQSSSTTSSTSLPASSSISETTPTRTRFRSHASEEFLDHIPSEAENRLRQLNKAARMFGERVPPEYILYGASPTTSPLPLGDEPTDPVLPVLDELEPIDVPVTNFMLAPPEEMSPPSFCRCGTSSPVLPSKDYDEVEHNGEAEPESPTLTPSSPAPSTKKLATDSLEPLNTTTPFLLRHPRPKPRASNKSLPSVENGVQETPKTTTGQPRSSLTRPQTSYAGSTRSWDESTSSYPRPDSPFLESAVPIHTWISTTWSSPKNEGRIARQNCGQGWSGEWNRSDMQDVITKLRQLK